MIDAFVGRGALGIYTFYSTIAIGMLSLGASVSHQFLPKIIAAWPPAPTRIAGPCGSFFWSLAASAVGMLVLAAGLILPLLAMLQLAQYAASVGVFFLMLPGVLLRILADVPSYALYAAKADTSLLICNLGCGASRPFCSISFWCLRRHLWRRLVRQHRQRRAAGRAVGAGVAQDATGGTGTRADGNRRSSDGTDLLYP